MDPCSPSEPVVARLRAITLALPESLEEDAWRGIRWKVRSTAFAHVLVVQDGQPRSYSLATGLEGPATVLTFRSSGEELHVLSHAGPPYFKPPWSSWIVGIVLDHRTDWTEVTELLTESYRCCAPQKLARLLDEPSRQLRP